MQISYLNALRAFEAVLRRGNFRSAADELGVTVAAVGQQIRSLEAYIGRPLFKRTPAGAKATNQALRLKERLTSGFMILHEVLAELKNVRPATQVAVTLPESFAENWFTGRISDFYRQNSEVDLRLNASNRRIDMATEGFDFAIRYSPPPEEEFDSIDLFGDHVLPVCTAEFARRYQLSDSLDSLSGIPLVHLDNRTPDPKWASWDSWCDAFGIDIGNKSGGVRFSKISSGLRAAISGQGLVLCGIVEAYDSIRNGQLVIPFGPRLNRPSGYRYRLLSLRGRSYSAPQRRFANWVTEISTDFVRSVNDLLRN